MLKPPFIGVTIEAEEAPPSLASAPRPRAIVVEAEGAEAASDSESMLAAEFEPVAGPRAVAAAGAISGGSSVLAESS
jgi:hypothetical protein